MHLVFKSEKAVGDWSFNHERNRAEIFTLQHDLLEKWDGRGMDFVNRGNHLHINAVRLSARASARC
jgi:hypothetical protein